MRNQKNPDKKRNDNIDYNQIFTKDSKNNLVLSLEGLVEYICCIYDVVSYSGGLFLCKKDGKSKGIFRKESGEVLKIVTYLLNQFNSKSLTQKKVISYLTEIKLRLHTINWSKSYPFNQRRDLIPVRNGVISINNETGQIKLLDHASKYRFTYCLNVNYNPSADTSFISGVLSDWMGDLAWILCQIPAQALLQSQSKVYKKAYLLIGGKDAGKSSYLDLLSELFGKELIARLDFQNITGNKFALAQLEGKLINLADDQPAFKLPETGSFKRLTGTSEHNVEPKYQMAYPAIVNPVYVFAANDFPSLPKNEDLNPFLDRFEIMTFDRKFGINPNFSKELLKEETLSAFLNLVLQEMITIVQRGDVLRTIEREETNYEMWALNGVPLYKDFILGSFVKDPDQYLTKDEMYSTYLDYCRDEEIPFMERGAFFRRLLDLGITDSRMVINGNRTRVIKGWSRKPPLVSLVN